MEQFKRILIQFSKFGVVGLINTGVSYSIYSLLVYIGFHYLTASVVAFFVSVLCSFLLNRKFVFKDNTGRSKRNVAHLVIKIYISYAFTGLIVYNALLFILIDALLVSKYIAPLLGLFVTVPLNFILNKVWVFKVPKSRMGDLG